MKRLVPLLVLVMAAPACGGGGKAAAPTTTVTDPAAAFAVRLQANLAKRRFALAWRSLHPAQQRVLTPRDLAKCWSQSSTGRLRHRLRFEAVASRDEPWRIPGGPRRPQPSRAISIRIVGPSGQPLDAFTQHVFAVRGAWRWIVSPGILAAYRRGACSGS